MISNGFSREKSGLKCFAVATRAVLVGPEHARPAESSGES